jgi:threonine/homoserine/homoserine lactone efflux protein
MDPSAALLAGLAAGLAIAMQVGAVSLLLVEAAVVSGPRVCVAAGMGVAAADLGFAVIAAAAGGAAGAALSSHETEIRVVAAIVIAAIAVHGLIALARERRRAGGGADTAGDAAGGEANIARGGADTAVDAAGGGADTAGDAAGGGADTAGGSAGAGAAHDRAPRTHFARFLAITAANPLTIASFAAVAAALSLDGPAAAAAFAAGVGIASAAWHVLLTLAAGHAGRWMTPRVRTGFAVGGRLAVLAIAAHLALG